MARHLPSGSGRFPALLLAHGSGGPRTVVEQYTPLLTRAGYAVFVVHYFHKTETEFATPETIEQNFRPWLEALGDAISEIERQPQVDAARIGMMGVSLGAFLALSLASFDRRVAAVVDMFGGMPEYFLEQARVMPPVLILHGEEDPIVPVREAWKLEALLKRLRTPYEMKTYPGQGHVLGATAGWDAAQRIYRFLENNLKRRTAVESPAARDEGPLPSERHIQ